MRTPRVGDTVAWFDIGPMRQYTGVVERIVSETIVKVRQPGHENLTAVFLCDLVTEEPSLPDPHYCCHERCSDYCTGAEAHDYQPCRRPCDVCDRAAYAYMRHLWRVWCARVRRALDRHPPYLANLILDTAELHGRIGSEWPRAHCDRCDQPLPKGRTHRVYRMGVELYECPERQ